MDPYKYIYQIIRYMLQNAGSSVLLLPYHVIITFTPRLENSAAHIILYQSHVIELFT